MAVAAVAAGVVGVLPAAASRGMDPDLLGDGVPGELAASGLHLVVMALVGLGLGSLLRRPVPALVTALGLVLVLPVLLGVAVDAATGPPTASSAPSAQDVGGRLALDPVDAGGQLAEAAAGSAAVPGGLAGPSAVLACWVLVPLAGAAVRLRRADLC